MIGWVTQVERLANILKNFDQALYSSDCVAWAILTKFCKRQVSAGKGREKNGISGKTISHVMMDPVSYDHNS